MNYLRYIYLIIITLLISSTTFSQEKENKEIKHVLYFNSYAPSYSWSDNLTNGVLATFKPFNNIIIYMEYLDGKRFKDDNFELIYELTKNKYKGIDIDLVILSDNLALDFLIKYSDQIAPKVPIIFCGINNPQDYKLENTRFYGIKEGLEQDSVNQLILKVIPEVKKIYFISDSTSTSLVNIKRVKQLEPKYAGIVKFEYINNISIDSLLKVIPTLKKGNAIARIDIFQDINKKPINPDYLLQKIAKVSPIPIFTDSEPSFGKGILGGIINSGYTHGSDMAKLALKFIENPTYVPKQRIALPKDYYYFDFNIVEKYNINPELLPEESIIINKPSSVLALYSKYIISTLIILILLIAIIIILSTNIRRRKKAEKLVQQKLLEIQDKNKSLKEVNEMINNMNTELEESNYNLSITNLELDDSKKKAVESDRLKSAFLANMSHEIRTPMNSIVGFSSLLAEPNVNQEDRERFSSLITKSSEQLLNLINDILDLSKTEANSLNITKKNFAVKELMQELIDLNKTQANKPNIKYIISDCSKLENIYLNSDILRIKQILVNFISNAIKFTDNGEIEVGCKKNDNKIIFFVRDTGIGIDKKYHKDIFTRFWKIENTETKLYPGTGLGLSISKKLAKLLKGKIWVESELGKGSIFYFSLKENKQNNSFKEQTDFNKRTQLTRINIEGCKVAIAEDEEANLQLLIDILRKQKVELLTFTNGKEISDFFINNSHESVDVILMDIKMPEMDGYAATKLIKSKNNKIPIIAQTAYAMPEDISIIMKNGFDDYISKPIKAELLLAKIDKYVIK